MKTYSGRCHCGAVRFKLETDEITTACRCNCSICTRKGATMSMAYFPPHQIAVQGLESLSVYRFGEELVNHYFCKTCGVYPFHDVTSKPGHYRVNLGCIDGVDLGSLEVKQIDGRLF